MASMDDSLPFNVIRLMHTEQHVKHEIEIHAWAKE
jgi:hypothetical protein